MQTSVIPKPQTTAKQPTMPPVMGPALLVRSPVPEPDAAALAGDEEEEPDGVAALEA